jgi:UDP-N-acetylglucosamine acyltransferase
MAQVADAVRTVEGIHPSAVVDRGARLGSGVTVGPGSIVEADVEIGDDTWIGAHAVIASGTRLGRRNRVYHGAILGTEPQHLGDHGDGTKLIIGDDNVLREYCSINRGSAATGQTTLGNGCYIMMYVHLGHDCRLGNQVIMANATNVAGHVDIDDHANISGLVPIHQFVRIGKYTFISGGYRVLKDVPPYIIASEHSSGFCGLNTVGLQRHGFGKEQISTIKQAYRLLYQESLNRSQAVTRIKSDLPDTPEIQEILTFIESSDRGIL